MNKSDLVNRLAEEKGFPHSTAKGNPRSGVKAEVKPKRLPFFKVGKELRERVDIP